MRPVIPIGRGAEREGSLFASEDYGWCVVKQLCFRSSSQRPPKSQPEADDRRRLRRRRNPLPRRREETPEAAEGGGGNLLFCSGLLLLQMTGRNRHLQKKGLGGKKTACPLKPKWMRWSRFAARRVDVSVRPATKPSGAAPGGFSLPPQKGDRTRFPGGLRAGKGGRMRRFHRGSKFR